MSLDESLKDSQQSECDSGFGTQSSSTESTGKSQDCIPEQSSARRKIPRDDSSPVTSPCRHFRIKLAKLMITNENVEFSSPTRNVSRHLYYPDRDKEDLSLKEKVKKVHHLEDALNLDIKSEPPKEGGSDLKLLWGNEPSYHFRPNSPMDANNPSDGGYVVQDLGNGITTRPSGTWIISADNEVIGVPLPNDQAKNEQVSSPPESIILAPEDVNDFQEFTPKHNSTVTGECVVELGLELDNSKGNIIDEDLDDSIILAGSFQFTFPHDVDVFSSKLQLEDISGSGDFSIDFFQPDGAQDEPDLREPFSITDLVEGLSKKRSTINQDSSGFQSMGAVATISPNDEISSPKPKHDSQERFCVKTPSKVFKPWKSSSPITKETESPKRCNNNEIHFKTPEKLVADSDGTIATWDYPEDIQIKRRRYNSP